MRGGFWRGFFSKYAESNLLHKKMLRVSWKLHHATPKGAKRGAKRNAALARATTNLLRAQCNDAYWHGIFGGLYAPHLRTALWRELVRAETVADGLHHGAKAYQTITQLDFDADGQEEIEITSPEFAALIKPSGGGTTKSWISVQAAFTLSINSPIRRKWRPTIPGCRTRSRPLNDLRARLITDQIAVGKEAGLENCLKHDCWPRNGISAQLLFEKGKTHEDFEALRLGELAAFASGDYAVEKATPRDVTLAHEAALCCVPKGIEPAAHLHAVKIFKFDGSQDGFTVSCGLNLSRLGPASGTDAPVAPQQFMVGLEIVLNLLAPNISDRYFEFSGSRQPLEWSGVVEGSRLRVADEWQDVAVEIEARGASQLWIAPIETVSESEEGFERVYQGSQIMALWDVNLAPSGPWSAETTLPRDEGARIAES